MASGWSKKQIADVEARLGAYAVIPGTIGVARKYAELRRWFFRQVGENDLGPEYGEVDPSTDETARI